MRKFLLATAAILAGCGSQPAATAQLAAVPNRPKLTIVISVDQFSANLFEAYRPMFNGGLARLSRGTVFRNGFQAHAATETCPGHSTLLTGNSPAHTGIIANAWYDERVSRTDKIIY
jgi:predicted AlkP superfamily pyrophosphatase or phosphodiesterase